MERNAASTVSGRDMGYGGALWVASCVFAVSRVYVIPAVCAFAASVCVRAVLYPVVLRCLAAHGRIEHPIKSI